MRGGVIVLGALFALPRWRRAEFPAASIRLAGERGVKRFAAEFVVEKGWRLRAIYASFHRLERH